MDRDNPLSQLIRRRMAITGLSQRQLSALMGERGVPVTKAMVSQWWAGHHVSDRYRLHLIDILGLSLHDLQLAATLRDLNRSEELARERERSEELARERAAS